MPVGVDRHVGNDNIPETKKLYEIRGTPEVVMIDKEGMIRIQQLGWFDPAAGEAYLETLLGNPDSPKRLEPVEKYNFGPNTNRLRDLDRRIVFA